MALKKHIENLRIIIEAVCSNTYSHAQIKDLVALCHAIAIVHLRKKLSSGRLNLSVIHLDLHDIAYDVIAELFRTDEHNSLVQLTSYFESINYNSVSDVQLLDHLRRIVFSKVNQGIYRIYFEYDSSLGKIIRNIKLSVQALGNFEEVDRFGEVFLVPAFHDANFHLPFIPPEDFEKTLRSQLKGMERIPEVMSKLPAVFRQYPMHAQAVPLVALAIVIRKIYSQDFPAVDSTLQHTSGNEDIHTMIHLASEAIREKYKAKYVGKRKISADDYEKLFAVIRKNLSAVAIQQDGADFSLYEHLQNEIPNLTKRKYQSRHRAILEYLLQLTKKELGNTLKKGM